jgi:hypothetical protein
MTCASQSVLNHSSLNHKPRIFLQNMRFCSDFDGQAFIFNSACDYDKSNVHYNEAVSATA